LSHTLAFAINRTVRNQGGSIYKKMLRTVISCESIT